MSAATNTRTGTKVRARFEDLGFQAQTGLRLEYDVYFPSTDTLKLDLKLPGFGSLPAGRSLWDASSGGIKRADSASIRIHARPAGHWGTTKPYLEAYAYAQSGGGKTFTDWGLYWRLSQSMNGTGSSKGDEFQVPVGRWATITVEAQMNTPGNADGALRVWLDGAQGIDINDLRWVDAAPYTWTQTMYESFYNEGSHPATTFSIADMTLSTITDATAPTAPTAGPTVSGGADVAAHAAGTPLTRTAVENGNGSTITGRRWSIEAGSPAGVWTVIGTATTLQWTPTVPGTYNLRYQATNANGSTTDDVKVVVTAPTTAVPTAAPTVSAGTDVAAHTAGTPLTRTADEDGNGSTITGRRWSIEAGSPAGVWTIIGSATTLQWTPTVPGTYTLRYQATNANGSTTDDVKVVVNAPPTSTSTYVQRWTGLDGSPWPAELVMSTVGNAPGTASLRAGRGQISGTADYRGLVGTLTRGGTVPSFGGNVQGTVDVVRSTSGEQYTGFELRRQANGDAYKLEFRGTDLVLYRRIGGVDTLIARRAWTLGTTNTRLGFRVDARNAISVKMFPVGGRDPGWTVLATDATPIPAATATSDVGIYHATGWTTPSAARFDDLTVSAA